MYAISYSLSSSNGVDWPVLYGREKDYQWITTFPHNKEDLENRALIVDYIFRLFWSLTITITSFHLSLLCTTDNKTLKIIWKEGSKWCLFIYFFMDFPFNIALVWVFIFSYIRWGAKVVIVLKRGITKKCKAMHQNKHEKW